MNRLTNLFNQFIEFAIKRSDNKSGINFINRLNKISKNGTKVIKDLDYDILFEIINSNLELLVDYFYFANTEEFCKFMFMDTSDDIFGIEYDFNISRNLFNKMINYFNENEIEYYVFELDED